MRSACAVLYCHQWPAWSYQFFFTVTHKRNDFQKRVIEYKTVVSIFPTAFLENVSNSKQNWARCYFLLLLQALNFLLRLKCLTFSTTSFHFPQSWTQVIQFLNFICQMSCLMSSSHLYLGLPCDLLVRGCHLNIFLTVLVSGILCTWPNQLSIWALIWMSEMWLQMYIGLYVK